MATKFLIQQLFIRVLRDSSAGSNNEFTTDYWQSLLERICLLCAVLLILVWPLPGTIAARNIALVIGCLSSLVWMFRSKPIFALETILPILCLLAVPIWLWIHYFVWPTDTAAQFYELKGTWLRVILGVIMASGLGLMISIRPNLIYWIWFAMVALALVSLVNFLQEVWILQQWLIPNYHFPFKGKFALVNFLTYPCLFAYAILYVNFIHGTDVPQKISNNTLMGFALFVILICWLNLLNAQALNGILIAGLAGFILLILFIKSTALDLKEINSRKIFSILSLALLLYICLSVFWQIDKKNHKKLDTLLDDIQISMQIDKYSAWQEDSRYEQNTRPINSEGRVVVHSTYSRAAWFVKGLDLLQDNLLGTGFSHLAFRYYMIQENPYSRVIMTHSGWLDYALGLGLPGLTLTWLAMFLVMRQAYSLTKDITERNPLAAYLALWTISGLWLLWWPSELSEREFIEQLFFMVALFATATVQYRFINSIPSK
jgi:hypothetical protein